MAEQLADVFDVQIQFPLDLRTVKADLNARNAIGTFQRYEGLETYVISEGIKYRLEGGITNDDWVDVAASNGGKQSVTVGTASPTGGTNGDIYFRNVTGGTEVWYNNAGTWGSMGTIPTGVTSATLNNTLDFSTTSSTLDSAYPTAKTGDIVYSEDAALMWTKLDAGKWTRTNLDIV